MLGWEMKALSFAANVFERWLVRLSALAGEDFEDADFLAVADA